VRLEAGDFAVRLLPERGLDVAEAWLEGVQLAWLSGAGFDGEDWGGGLVTTRGLQNVGAASEGFPLHGRYHDRRADVLKQSDGIVRGRVQDGPFLLEREVRIGEAWLRIRDVTTNVDDAPEPAPLLYHVNIGGPLWAPGGEVAIAELVETIPRDQAARAGLANWSESPEPAELPERVFEHRFRPLDGAGSGRVRNKRTGFELRLSWGTAELPRLHQWVDPRPGCYGFALEPANCSVLGRAADRAAGTLPVLVPGESRKTWLELRPTRI
jgi:Domain of unknown function (DUF4432)